MIRYEDSFTPSFAPSFTRCLGVRMPVVVGLLVSALLLMACNPMSSGLSASERLEIETMVEDYFVAASSPGVDVPEYEARVEEVSGDWARVALWPVGVDNVDKPSPIFSIWSDKRLMQRRPTKRHGVGPSCLVRKSILQRLNSTLPACRMRYVLKIVCNDSVGRPHPLL